ncbi:MAG: PEP-CTERM sorting domain-containing protein [Fimbriimonadia bacterium]
MNRLVGLCLGGLAVLIPVSAHAYLADLYFRNLETGVRSFVTPVRPGDRVAISFDFSTSPDENLAWTELSGFINFQGSSVVTWAVAQQIVQYIRDFHDIPSLPYSTFVYGPGEVRNDKNDPGRQSATFITSAGLYWRMNIDPNEFQAKHGFNRIAEFTVPLDAQVGETLEFGRRNLLGTNDVSSRIIDSVNRRDGLQFNRIIIVPEPAAVIGLFIGVWAVAALGRRKRE